MEAWNVCTSKPTEARSLARVVLYGEPRERDVSRGMSDRKNGSGQFVGRLRASQHFILGLGCTSVLSPNVGRLPLS